MKKRHLIMVMALLLFMPTIVSASTVDLPFIGTFEYESLSLPILSIVLGFIDGFNPCAMWILLFLISMMLGMENRKRMWILGLTFIFVSALTYFAFMAAWLNLILFLGSIVAIRYAIGLLGIGGGIFNIRSFFKSVKEGDGCEVVDDKKRSNIMERIRKFTREESLLLSILGISLLAISVNILELMCSAGIPAMFTSILAENDLSAGMNYFYLTLYIILFMIDDIIVFSAAMITFKLVGISTKYTKYSHLIGGILLFVIGALLIFKPEVLFFG
jgi:hypothetical protein